MKLPVIGPFNTTDSVNIDSQRTVNWFPEKNIAGKSEVSLYPIPGSVLVTTVGVGPIRGTRRCIITGNLFVVSGSGFYVVNTAGVAVQYGTLNTSSGTVQIASSSTQIVIVDGVNGYLFTTSTGVFTVISDVDFPDGADQVQYIEGYFVVNDPLNSQGLNIQGQFFWSDLHDGSAWTGTNFATAERDSDKLISIQVLQRELWLLGETSAEVWYNSGGNPVFTPLGSTFSAWGIVARDSVQVLDEDIIWLSKTTKGQGLVVRGKGLQVQRVSTRALEAEIESYGTISDAISFTTQYKGHLWYVLTFPTADRTWVYDVTEEVWFEWKSYGMGRVRYNTCTFFNNKQYVGDYSTGKLYYLDPDVNTENGALIEYIRRTTHMYQENKYLFYKMLELEFEYGVGGAADAQVMLRWSDDHGHTWSNEYWKPLGKTGEYNKRLKWKRLGRSLDRVFEIKITDACRPVLIQGYAEIKAEGE